MCVCAHQKERFARDAAFQFKSKQESKTNDESKDSPKLENVDVSLSFLSSRHKSSHEKRTTADSTIDFDSRPSKKAKIKQDKIGDISIHDREQQWQLATLVHKNIIMRPFVVNDTKRDFGIQLYLQPVPVFNHTFVLSLSPFFTPPQIKQRWCW